MKTESFMSKEQTCYYEFLCMDAYTTTQDEDMDDTCKSIFKYVNKLSDRQCVIEFQQELMSDYEMELLEDEARDMAMNEPDLEDLETRVTQIMGDLLYTKGK